MAWSKNDAFGLFSLTGTTEIALDLNPRYSYKIIHTGDDSAGNDDANSDKAAWLSTVSATITANNTVQDKKMWIASDTSETIGPGISKLYVVSTADADAAIQIIRKDAYDAW
jgi:hypothetical protein